jgi:Protein of unknown function (DUF2568)
VPDSARALVLAGRFLLELGMLAALAYAGSQADGPLVVRILLAVGLPVAAGALWGAFVAPKARIRVSEPARLAIELALFASAALALVLVGLVVSGLTFGGIALAWSALARV